MSEKYSGFPTVLKRGNADGPPETFTAIAGIRSVDPPSGKTTTFDSTTMDNPNAFKTKLAGLIDGGSSKLTLAFDPADAGHQAMTQDFVSRVLRDFQIVLPDTGQTVVAFTAIVTDMGPKTPMEGLFTCDFALEISGKPTWGTFA
jgi:predicted secreted protein